MRKKSAIEVWVDNHREFILIVFILPIGKVVSIIENFKEWINRPDPKKHEERIERVINEVKYFNTNGKQLRTDRRGASSLNTRMSDKSAATKIHMADMRSIVFVNKEKNIIRVEPFVTIGEVVEYLDKQALQLETAIEMKGATMGGLVLAIGMTTSSHHTGLMHDIVEAYEIITARGERIRATRSNEHEALFRAIPFSHGTLGLLVALELRIIPASKYIRLVYRPFYDFDTFVNEHSRLLQATDSPTYLEAQVFDKNKAVIIEGYPALANEKLPINHINRWYKPFFFKHVEAMLELGEGKSYSELVPIADFLMRHERSMCMTMGKIIPTANNALFRYTMGWTMPPNMKLLKSSRPPEERERSMKQQVYQDFAFPVKHFKEILEHIHQEFEIYPLLVYPCRVFDKGGLVRLPGEHGKKWDGTIKSELFLNLGIYGTPKKVVEGDTTYPTIMKVREIEAKIRAWGGFLHTYVDVFSTSSEYEQMFDHMLWHEMRKKYHAEGVFPTIYTKIKPELDPLQFISI